MTNLLKLKGLANVQCVPDKFRYTFPQDGWTAMAMDRGTWYGVIAKHYKDNDYEQPENWRELADHQLCQFLSGEWCEYQAGGDAPTPLLTLRFELGDIINGTKVLTSFKTSPDDVVNKDLAESRALACSRCYANVPIPGCAACHQLANFIAESSGGRPTSHDAQLKACGICHCSNAAQVWIPIEHLAKGVDAAMLSKFETVEHCWKRQELETLRDSSLKNT